MLTLLRSEEQDDFLMCSISNNECVLLLFLHGKNVKLSFGSSNMIIKILLCQCQKAVQEEAVFLTISCRK